MEKSRVTRRQLKKLMNEMKKKIGMTVRRLKLYISRMLHHNIPNTTLQKVLIRWIRCENRQFRSTIRRFSVCLVEFMKEVPNPRRIRISVQNDFYSGRRLEERHFVGGCFIKINSLIGVTGGESFDERFH